MLDDIRASPPPVLLSSFLSGENPSTYASRCSRFVASITRSCWFMRGPSPAAIREATRGASLVCLGL